MKRVISVSFLFMFLTGCITIGKQFEVNKLKEVQLNKTTKYQVGELFGAPFMVGKDDGKLTWTYAHYEWSAFDQTKTTDLIFTFDVKDVVVRYKLNSSDPVEKTKIDP